jgi:hypothetical protein
MVIQPQTLIQPSSMSTEFDEQAYNTAPSPLTVVAPQESMQAAQIPLPAAPLRVNVTPFSSAVQGSAPAEYIAAPPQPQASQPAQPQFVPAAPEQPPIAPEYVQSQKAQIDQTPPAYSNAPSSEPPLGQVVSLMPQATPHAAAKPAEIYSNNTQAVWRARRSTKVLNIVSILAILALFGIIVGYWLSLGAPTRLEDAPFSESFMVVL